MLGGKNMPILKNRTVRKQFLLDEETNSKLKMVALSAQTSENEIVNRALNAYLCRFKKKED